MVNNDKGGLEEAMRYGSDDWTYLFRITGAPFDVPDYSLNPVDDALRLWYLLRQQIADLPRQVWIHLGNELDKNRSDWLARWGYSIGKRAVEDGRRVCLYNFAAGEPEPDFWARPAVETTLTYASRHRDQIAIGLHEYSYHVDDDKSNEPPTPAILRDHPRMLGRYQQLWQACDLLAISHPTVLITEFGWCHNAIPDQDRALRDIQIANELYQDPDILGAGLWYSGGGAAWKGICNKVERLFPGWGDYMASLDPTMSPPPKAPIPCPPLPPQWGGIEGGIIDLAQFMGKSQDTPQLAVGMNGRRRNECRECLAAFSLEAP